MQDGIDISRIRCGKCGNQDVLQLHAEVALVLDFAITPDGWPAEKYAEAIHDPLEGTKYRDFGCVELTCNHCGPIQTFSGHEPVQYKEGEVENHWFPAARAARYLAGLLESQPGIDP